MARCPAHEDRSPSLSLFLPSSGEVLVHCFAGCAPADVLGAVGMSMADLFPEDERRRCSERESYIMGVRRGTEKRTALSHAVAVLFVAAEDARQKRYASPEDARSIRSALETVRQASPADLQSLPPAYLDFAKEVRSTC